MSKTPVSILQEMMVKKATLPNYELVYDGGGTHINKFTYQVSCDGLSATGTGRSKKHAKHEAAKAMLEAIAAHRGYLQLEASPAESPVRTPLPATVPEAELDSPNVPFVNAIGALQDLCIENNLHKPEYVQISDVGPPHAKIFTIQCTVAAFKEIGVARTKKQAKQEAAKKLFNKITDLVAELKDVDIPSEADENQIVTRKGNLGVNLSDYHTRIKSYFEDCVSEDLIEKLESFMPQDEPDVSEESIQHLLLEFRNLLSTLSLDITNIPLTTDKQNIFFMCMKINTFPEIVQVAVGQTETEAKFLTIQKLLKSLIVFLR